MKINQTKIVLTVALLILPLVTMSYFVAIKTADKIISPVKDELQRVSCQLRPFNFENGQFTENINGLGWKVAFNTNKYFANDFEVYVSVLGKVKMTSPRDLVERINQKSIN